MNDAIIATANTHLQELLKELPSALQKTISTFAEEQQCVIMRHLEEWKCLVIHDYEKSSFEEADFQTAIQNLSYSLEKKVVLLNIKIEKLDIGKANQNLLIMK